MTTWIERARLFVERITADLPADADLKTRRNALWGKGHPFHQGTSWGRKAYGRACREYLRRHGDPRHAPRAIESAPNFGPDIIFPFRGGGQLTMREDR